MNTNELRALADAIVYRDPLAIARVADYLRAQADAQPVPAVPAGWKVVPVEPTPEMLQAGANVMEPNGIGWYDADISRAEYRAMLAAAPAAPQSAQQEK